MAKRSAVKLEVGSKVRSATCPNYTGVVTAKSEHNAELWVRWSDGTSQLTFPSKLVAV